MALGVFRQISNRTTDKMADISIQFHALPAEIACFTAETMASADLRIAAIGCSPFVAKAITFDELTSMILAATPPFRRFAITLGDPILTAKHELDFADKNPDHLRLDIGRLSDATLEQSWLSARTNAPNAIAVWRSIATRLRKITLSGVTAIDPKTGASNHIKSFRFTQGAKDFSDRGGKILPPAGTTQLRLD